jgi:hypothetical protein
MLFVGDVHAQMKAFRGSLRHAGARSVLQLGDLGVGFVSPAALRLKPHIRFIRGNHDDPARSRKHPNYLGDFGYLPRQEMLFISGAMSVDWSARAPGVTWWPEEELEAVALAQVVEMMALNKPKIVVSHDCPLSIKKKLFGHLKHKSPISRTQLALESALERWRPRTWVFAHYHETRHTFVAGTDFICVGEMDSFELPGMEW